MVATAQILEQVGVSAYLGAAPLVSDGSILSTAGSILTIEARHQSFINVGLGQPATGGSFDTPLSAKQVFSLAAPFITSCPEGSNLILTAFPTLTMAGGGVAAAAIGQTIQLESEAAAGAQFCSFTNGNAAGGTLFSPFVQGQGCQIPSSSELVGPTYINLVTQAPLTGVITDDIIVAGPMFVNLPAIA
jgi:hypothetical protein